jgi:hypothetical protein
MSANLYRLSDKILLEYIFNTKSFNTSQYSFRKIDNNVEGFSTIVNSNNSIIDIGNTVDNTIVDLQDGTAALLDNDSAYWYPSVNPNIIVNNINLVNNRLVQYDTVRIHLTNGYNLDNYIGFTVSIYCRTKSDKILRLCNFSWTKEQTDFLYYSNRPKQIDVLVFDKYVEFAIPSFNYILQEQILDPSNTDNLSYVFTNGDLLDEQNTLYCEFNFIKKEDNKNGYYLYYLEEGKRILFSSVDEFNGLTAVINENPNGYFEFYAEWNGQSIEDFIYSLNSIPGNNYYIIHELNVFLQNGNSFQEVEELIKVQNSKYDSINYYCPVIPNLGYATSLSIDYNVRLFNRADGRNIIKSGSISTININRYSINKTKLNVGNVTQPINIINKVYKKNLTLNIPEKINQPKLISYVYVNNNNIVIQGNTEIEISPFDNIYKFSLINKDNDKESLLELSDVDTYYLAFILDDNSELLIPEMLTLETSKTNGELSFKMSQEQSLKVMSSSNNVYYIIVLSANGTKTKLASGTWYK